MYGYCCQTWQSVPGVSMLDEISVSAYERSTFKEEKSFLHVMKHANISTTVKGTHYILYGHVMFGLCLVR